MVVRFASWVLDQHIAPGVSAFTAADIPDMSSWAKESPHWVTNFFLNSVFTGAFAPPMDAYAYNFLRRAQYAFTEHALARTKTLAFLAPDSQSPSNYVDALFH